MLCVRVYKGFGERNEKKGNVILFSLRDFLGSNDQVLNIKHNGSQISPKLSKTLSLKYKNVKNSYVNEYQGVWNLVKYHSENRGK